MDRRLFDKFFSLGHISVGPTVITPDGNWVGKVQIFSTKNDFFLNNKVTLIGVKEFENVVSEDMCNALKYLCIEKNDFDRFITKCYIIEWESMESNSKPDISLLRKNVYL